MEALPTNRELYTLGVFATKCDSEKGYTESDMLAVLMSKGIPRDKGLAAILKFPQYSGILETEEGKRYKPSDRKKELIYDPNGSYYVGQKIYHEGLDLVGTVTAIENHRYVRMVFTDGEERRMQGKGRESPQ